MAHFAFAGSYLRFSHLVTTQYRHVQTGDAAAFLAAVIDTAASREITLLRGTMLWRAQLGHAYRIADEFEDLVIKIPWPHPLDRMKPLPDRAMEGRANPKGICYLYLATLREVAQLEVRPPLGSTNSVGQFELIDDVRLIDCSRNVPDEDPMVSSIGPEPDEVTRDRVVWGCIDRAFSNPVNRSDDTADYAPTQVIAEQVKLAGYHGLMYRSAFHSEDGRNVVLFAPDLAKLKSCHLFTPTEVKFTFDEQDGYFVRDP